MLGGQLGLEVPRTKLPGTAWFIQISDTHLSKFDHLPDRQKLYGDKLGDLRCMLLPCMAGLSYIPSCCRVTPEIYLQLTGSLQGWCWLHLSQARCSSLATW